MVSQTAGEETMIVSRFAKRPRSGSTLTPKAHNLGKHDAAVNSRSLANIKTMISRADAVKESKFDTVCGARNLAAMRCREHRLIRR